MRLLLESRIGRAAATACLVLATVAPAAALPPGAAAADNLVLRIGTTQNAESINPWNAYLWVEYEIFQLNYDLLVGFGENLEPIPAYAESWSSSADGKTWTFKCRAGMKWSDGQPATCEDARWTIQFALDAEKAGDVLGYGYISPYFIDAGIASVASPDPETLVVTTKYPTDRVLSMDAPILPKHIWSKYTTKTVNDFTNDPPVVGSGPYTAVEFKTGQYVRFVRNPNYWGKQGAEDEVVIRFFPDSQDTMVQAFKQGELDYIEGPSAQQFDQLKTMPGVVAINAPGTEYDELGFNTYTKPVAGGGASTKALQDPAFRDALGYAIDRQALVDKVLHGYGSVGTTMVPPYYVKFHVEPTNPRTFDIALAKQKLDAAGYTLNAQGQRLDKQGKALNLRLYFPSGSGNLPNYAQFIVDWFAQLGIKVRAQAFDSGALADILLGPSGTEPPKGKLAYDMFLWDWVGDNGDPNTMLQPFLCSSIGSQSDSQWCDPAYDALYKEQNEAPNEEARKAPMAQMQQLVYDQAPYQILVNTANLQVYRTDKFAGWETMPAGTGTPLFVMGNINYTLLTDATAAPAATPVTSAAASAGASAGAASAAPPAESLPPETPTAATTSDNTPLLVGGVVVLILVIAAGLVLVRRRPGGPRPEEE